MKTKARYKNVSPADPVFQGGGEAGIILSSIDWRKHPLGLPSGWPQSLRSSLNFCLSSLFPSCIFWGKDRFYLFNDAYAPLIGPGYEKTLAQKYPEARPELWKAVQSLIRRIEETGKAAWIHDIPMMARTGGKKKELLYSFCLTPLRLEDGTVGGISITGFQPAANAIHAQSGPKPEVALLGVHVPKAVSQVKGVDILLTASDRIYRGIGESMNYGVWICDPKGKNLYASDSFLNLVGMTQKECSEFGWKNVLHPDEAEATLLAWQKCAKEGAFWEREHRFKGVDGEWHPVLARGVPIKDAKGNILYWAGINLDISALKETDAKLRKNIESMQLLAETLGQLLRAEDPQKIAAELFPKIAQHVGADTYFNFMVGPDGESLNLHSAKGVSNEILKGMGRLEFGQAICGTVAQIRKPIVANDIQNSDYDKAGLVRGLGIQTYACNPLMVGDRLLGTISFASRKRAAFDPDEIEFMQIVAQYVAIAMDNANLHEAVQKELMQHKRMEAKLSHSNHELEQFAYVSSHDLQEPLRTISNYVDLLAKSSAKLNEEEREYLGFIQEGSARALQLIRELLTYASIGKAEQALLPVDLDQALDEVTLNLQSSIEESGAKITRDNLPRVNAVGVQMVQLMQNLISNAIKYRDGNRPEIHVSARKDGRRWVIGVSDNGIGIDPKYKDQIFMIFKRLHSRDKYSGTGVGLAICKKIMNFHGGEIWVEPARGRGSQFYFTLPA